MKIGDTVLYKQNIHYKNDPISKHTPWYQSTHSDYRKRMNGRVDTIKSENQNWYFGSLASYYRFQNSRNSNVITLIKDE